MTKIVKENHSNRNELEFLSSAKIRLVSQIESLQWQIEVLQNDNNRLFAVREDEKKGFLELEKKFKENEQENSDLKDKIRTMQRENQGLNENIRNKEEEIRQRENDLKTSEKESKELKKILKKYEDSIQENKKLKNNLEDLIFDTKKLSLELEDSTKKNWKWKDLIYVKEITTI